MSRNRWSFVFPSVRNKSRNDINHKIDGASVTRMLNIRDIFELIVDCFDNKPLSKHELTGYVFTELFNRHSIVGITLCDFERKKLSSLIYDDMKFESEKPPHAGFTSSPNALKDLVSRDSDVLTHGNRTGVNELCSLIKSYSSLQIRAKR